MLAHAALLACAARRAAPAAPQWVARRAASTDASRWETRRLLWLTTGSFVDPQRGPHGEAVLARLADTLRRLRAQRAERASLAKPIRVRESNVLAALREPSRLLDFNRPLPLPRLVGIMNQLWEEEVVAQRK